MPLFVVAQLLCNNGLSVRYILHNLHSIRSALPLILEILTNAVDLNATYSILFILHILIPISMPFNGFTRPSYHINIVLTIENL